MSLKRSKPRNSPTIPQMTPGSPARSALASFTPVAPPQRRRRLCGRDLAFFSRSPLFPLHLLPRPQSALPAADPALTREGLVLEVEISASQRPMGGAPHQAGSAASLCLTSASIFPPSIPPFTFAAMGIASCGGIEGQGSSEF